VDRDIAVEAGACDMLMKPISPGDLAISVKNAISGLGLP
jgi:DNA-binding response OmpR family regulator